MEPTKIETENLSDQETINHLWNRLDATSKQLKEAWRKLKEVEELSNHNAGLAARAGQDLAQKSDIIHRQRAVIKSLNDTVSLVLSLYYDRNI